jgi:hypothetical protein
VTPPRYPGAVWLSTGSANGKMPNGPDAGSLHEAVTRAKSVFGWVQTAKSCHAYNAQNGYFEQYAEWDDWMYGCSDGNSHVITIESFDGLLIHQNPYWEEGMGGIYGDSANTGRWDAGQCERAADVLAFLNVNVGIALELSTTAGHPGWNGHRIGIDQWRTDSYNSGEVWTQHNGKPCPGDLRMLQIPGILARAREIKAAVQAGADWLPTGEVNLTTALARGGNTPPPTPPPPTNPGMDWIMTLPGAPATFDEAVDLIVNRIVAVLGKDPKSLQHSVNIGTNNETHRANADGTGAFQGK